MSFVNFGASSLDFEVRVYLGDILNTGIVQNDIRFAIVETFKKEGIEIPFPQRDVNLKAGDIALLAEKIEEARQMAGLAGGGRPKLESLVGGGPETTEVAEEKPQRRGRLRPASLA